MITETQLGERERYKHFSHRHLLVLLESKKSKCYACKRLNIQGQPAYGCNLCGFYLHQSCFELQKVIYHISHLHYLTLRDSSNSGKRVCKACGKHLNGLIYHCASCDFNLDLDRASQHPSMKNWKVCGKYQDEDLEEGIGHYSHYHHLTLSDVGDVECKLWHKNIHGPNYGCAPCMFYIH